MLFTIYATKSISRVLYLTIIYLGLLLPAGSSDTTGKRGGQPHFASPSCSRWGLHSRKVANALVSSYLAFPPLPKASFGGISLLHFPSSYPDWVLSSTLPYGARTFLSCVSTAAIVWLTRKYYNIILYIKLQSIFYTIFC